MRRSIRAMRRRISSSNKLARRSAGEIACVLHISLSGVSRHLWVRTERTCQVGDAVRYVRSEHHVGRLLLLNPVGERSHRVERTWPSRLSAPAVIHARDHEQPHELSGRLRGIAESVVLGCVAGDHTALIAATLTTARRRLFIVCSFCNRRNEMAHPTMAAA